METNKKKIGCLIIDDYKHYLFSEHAEDAERSLHMFHTHTHTHTHARTRTHTHTHTHTHFNGLTVVGTQKLKKVTHKRKYMLMQRFIEIVSDPSRTCLLS